MNTYTIGEIVRLGLLKNHKGEPYKDKTTVIRIVKGMPHRRVRTAWGMGYSVSDKAIREHNRRTV